MQDTKWRQVYWIQWIRDTGYEVETSILDTVDTGYRIQSGDKYTGYSGYGIQSGDNSSSLIVKLRKQ